MGGLLHLVQQGGVWAGCGPAQAPHRCTKINVTVYPPTANVPITVLLYDGPLLCGFNVSIKGFSRDTKRRLYAVSPFFCLLMLIIYKLCKFRRSFVRLSPTRTCRVMARLAQQRNRERPQHCCPLVRRVSQIFPPP